MTILADGAAAGGATARTGNLRATVAARRFLSLDVARGVIMIVMALDHASLFWNSGRVAGEFALANAPFPGYPNGWQQLTREITHICAPGFQLLAGLGMAISVARRERAGKPQWLTSGDMLLRAAALFFCEWVLLGLFVGAPACFFIVLACIGSATAIFAAARFLPSWVILTGSLAVLLAAPFYGPTEILAPTRERFLANIWTRVALVDAGDAYSVFYPILPWAGFFGTGWWLGRRYAGGGSIQARHLVVFGVICVWIGVGLRGFGGSYGERMPGGEAGPLSAAFWAMAKYPPSPAFSMMTLGAMLLLCGLLRPIDDLARPPRLWRFVAVYGRTALFFYVVHFYLYATVPFATQTVSKHSLATTYLVWLAGLSVLWPLCLGYGKLRSRFATVLRYF